MLKIKRYISKNLLVKLLVFVALVAAALALDTYFENNPTQLEEIQAETEQQSHSQGKIYILAQATTVSVKSSVQKTPTRNQQIETHTKFLRKYHSIRNFQVLKAEVIQQTTPLITSYHYLVYQNHSLTPDDDPLS